MEAEALVGGQRIGRSFQWKRSWPNLTRSLSFVCLQEGRSAEILTQAPPIPPPLPHSRVEGLFSLVFPTKFLYEFFLSLVCATFHTHTHLLIPDLVIHKFRSLLRQVHSLFQSEFSTVRYNAYSFNSSGHAVAAYVLFFVFPSLLSPPPIYSSIMCFSRQFLRKM
jgi:hypothetical protein